MVEIFTQTSFEPYDRHHYKLEFYDGESIIFEDYEHLRAVWFQDVRTQRGDCNVIVLDKPNKKHKKTNGGFK